MPCEFVQSPKQRPSMCLAQTTIFRGALEISPHLGIPVWAYCQVRAQTLPSLKKLSIPALEADGDSCAVRQRPLLLVRGSTPSRRHAHTGEDEPAVL